VFCFGGIGAEMQGGGGAEGGPGRDSGAGPNSRCHDRFRCQTGQILGRHGHNPGAESENPGAKGGFPVPREDFRCRGRISGAKPSSLREVEFPVLEKVLQGRVETNPCAW
jgi:hypothetical protein